MALWKQAALCLFLFVAAAFLWLRFDSGATSRLKALGIDSRLIDEIASSSKRATGESRDEMPGGERAALVVTRKVGKAVLNNNVKAIGSGVAIRTASITPTDAGTVTALEVKAGDRLQAGDTIATLDSQAQEIAADRARLTLADAEKKLKRYRALRDSAAVTSVQLSDQESEVAADRLALKQAEYELGKRRINAPISGVIGILGVNVGDYVTTQTHIASIDDRSSILVDFQVPERFAGAIRIGGEIDAVSSAFPGRTFVGAVSAIDNRIDPDSRTLRVRAQLPNEDDLLRAGMSFLVTMKFPGDRYAAVDPLSVQWDSSGAYLWKVDAGKAERVDIKVVQRNPQSILVAGKLSAGDRVVTEGVQVLRAGTDVRVADSDEGADSAPPGRPGARHETRNHSAMPEQQADAAAL